MSLLAVLVIIPGTSIWFPESPKYYFMQGNYQKAREILGGISQRASSKPVRVALFKEEAAALTHEIDGTYFSQS